MIRQVLFLGGNGHCAARLVPARAPLAQLQATDPRGGFELYDVAYPGFEDRPRAASLDDFLADIGRQIDERVSRDDWHGFLYATGIGGLLALCLRGRGRFLQTDLLLQAPILWGLERRAMPRLMRFGPVRFLLRRLFRLRLFQADFVRRYFEKPLSPQMHADFFAGYAHCPALPDFFAWLTPQLLRELERQFHGRPEMLQRITVWWGSRDRVVTLEELAATEEALGLAWPVRLFPHWGHYPMIDDPADWVRTLRDALAPPEAVPGPVSPQAG